MRHFATVDSFEDAITTTGQALFGALCKESHLPFQGSQSEASEERQKDHPVKKILCDGLLEKLAGW